MEIKVSPPNLSFMTSMAYGIGGAPSCISRHSGRQPSQLQRLGIALLIIYATPRTSIRLHWFQACRNAYANVRTT
jgi:hypothetical protein